MTSDPSSSSPGVLNASSSTSAKRKRPSKIEIPNILREIPPEGNEHSFRDGAVCFAERGVAVASAKGKKKFMEDTHKLISSVDGDPSKGFFGVYDGHGGGKAADFVAERLHANILCMMGKHSVDWTKEEAIKAGYKKTDEEFLKQNLGSGACCVTAFIEGQEIAISNLGDCRAILCRGGVAEALTEDHRAEKEDEKRRIEEMGGFVEMHRGTWRVHGILSVSRSIGDAHLKQWVSAEPDTKILHLTPDMEFLVLASDGLWEEVGKQEAADVVKRLHGTRKEALRTPDPHNYENDENYGCVNVSPPSKLRRISLVKQQKGTKQSPSRIKPLESCKDGDHAFLGNIDSPPSKLRRISLFKRISTKTECLSSQDDDANSDQGFYSIGLVAACKELVNLAVCRGSLDDITVMIIDLNRFRSTSKPT